MLSVPAPSSACPGAPLLNLLHVNYTHSCSVLVVTAVSRYLLYASLTYPVLRHAHVSGNLHRTQHNRVGVSQSDLWAANTYAAPPVICCRSSGSTLGPNICLKSFVSRQMYKQAKKLREFFQWVMIRVGSSNWSFCWNYLHYGRPNCIRTQATPLHTHTYKVWGTRSPQFAQLSHVL